MNPDYLLEYYNSRIKTNPFYPIRPEDFDKIEKHVISKKGLEQLAILERDCLMGRTTIEDRILCCELMKLWAMNNRSLPQLLKYKKFIDIYIADHFRSMYYPDLEKEGIVEKKIKYDPKYSNYNLTWVKVILAMYYRLKKEWDKTGI